MTYSLSFPRKHTGFTLLELLIVIGLIGILVMIAAVAYSSAQKKTRDSRRVSDMKAIQNASEQYFADHNSLYPTSEAEIATYMPGGVPTDPKNSDTYIYTLSFPSSGYCHCAVLEGGNGNAGAACDFHAENKSNYCVSQLQ